MDWKRASVDDLKKYPYQKESLRNIASRIGALREDYQSYKCALGSDTAPVQGGTSRIEDRMLNNIVERQRLEHTYKATKKLVDLVERGLMGLNERERVVLERFFIRHEVNHVERLMDEWHYEKSRVYQVKDEALYKFTLCMYGLIDY